MELLLQAEEQQPAEQLVGQQASSVADSAVQQAALLLELDQVQEVEVEPAGHLAAAVLALPQVGHARPPSADGRLPKRGRGSLGEKFVLFLEKRIILRINSSVF